MPVTLAQAALNTQEDLDRLVIDEFRKQSAILDSLLFHDTVNPMGGGSTLTYGYHRVVAERAADIRTINEEYTPEEAEKDRFTVDLVPLGGSFEIDRVLAQTARSAEVDFQIRQLIKSSSARFNDALVNGATGTEGFDGLSEALTGTSTEIDASDLPGEGDWTDLSTSYMDALDAIDEWLSILDGAPTVILGNARAIAKFRAIARRANQYVERPVEGLTAGAGAPTARGFYGNALLVDAGAKSGSADPVIPVTAGATDLYAYRVGIDGFHGVSVTGQPLVRTWLPDFSTAGAVKKGEVEMGPLAVALKATRAASVLRGVTVSAGT
jgi:hypothetical protein